MLIEVRDRNEELIRQFNLVAPDVPTAVGSIVERACDAVVSPANSFGFMDGGVDYAYSAHFGWHVQEDLRGQLAGRPFGELLVGEALVIPTGNDTIPHVISAPTMRVPSRIEAQNVFLATRAAVKAAADAGMQHIIFPGMGTGCGGVPFEYAARAMVAGFAAGLGPLFVPSSWREAQTRHFALVG